MSFIAYSKYLKPIVDEHDTRLDSVEAKNTAQDTRLTTAESSGSAQDGRLVAVEAKNTAQDVRLATAELKDSAVEEFIRLIQDAMVLNKPDGTAYTYSGLLQNLVFGGVVVPPEVPPTSGGVATWTGVAGAINGGFLLTHASTNTVLRVYLVGDSIGRIEVMSSNIPSLWGNITLSATSSFAGGFPSGSLSLVNSVGGATFSMRTPFSAGETITDKITFGGIDYAGSILRGV